MPQVILAEVRQVLLADRGDQLGWSADDVVCLQGEDAKAIRVLVERHLRRNRRTLALLTIALPLVVGLAFWAGHYAVDFPIVQASLLLFMPLSWTLFLLAYAFLVALPRLQAMEQARGLMRLLTPSPEPDPTVELVDRDQDIAP